MVGVRIECQSDPHINIGKKPRPLHRRSPQPKQHVRQQQASHDPNGAEARRQDQDLRLPVPLSRRAGEGAGADPGVDEEGPGGRGSRGARGHDDDRGDRQPGQRAELPRNTADGSLAGAARNQHQPVANSGTGAVAPPGCRDIVEGVPPGGPLLRHSPRRVRQADSEGDQGPAAGARRQPLQPDHREESRGIAAIVRD